MLTRAAALELVLSHNPEPQMVRHALASEAVMRVLAQHFGEDADTWGLAGLLHDVDYPLTKDAPEQHGIEAMTIIGDRVPAEVLQAIRAHNAECAGGSPQSRMDFALRAGESVTGLIAAAALMRPTGMNGMETKSLKKKMKDKAFAANVSRERIRECEQAGLSMDDFLALAIAAMAAARENGSAAS
jgi:putative nucleotidyltransferase with HDIG domain